MQKSKPKKSIRPGEVIKIGPHRLFFGDARDKQGLEKLVGDNKIRMILSDPPYATAAVQSKAGFRQKLSKPKEIANDQLQSEDKYAEFMESWLKIALPYLERKNSIYVFNSDKMIFALKKAMDNCGLHFAQLLIWIKNQPVIGRLDYLPQHELIAYGWFGRHAFVKSQDKSILFCPKPHKSKLHPTMKPISLLRRLILNSSNVGDIIFDPFAGSGSLAIACEQTKRRAFMAEIDEEYCRTIIERLNRLPKGK